PLRMVLEVEAWGKPVEKVVMIEIEFQAALQDFRLHFFLPPSLGEVEMRRTGRHSVGRVCGAPGGGEVVPVGSEHHIVDAITHHPIQALDDQVQRFRIEKLIGAIPQLRLHAQLADIHLNAFETRNVLTFGSEPAELASGKAAQKFEGSEDNTQGCTRDGYSLVVARDFKAFVAEVFIVDLAQCDLDAGAGRRGSTQHQL